MRIRTVFIYLPEEHNHATAADELEHTLNFMLARRGVSHTSRPFWDDERLGYAEHGVRLDISESFDDDTFLRLLGSIVYVTSLYYDSIRIQLDMNCVTT